MCLPACLAHTYYMCLLAFLVPLIEVGSWGSLPSPSTCHALPSSCPCLPHTPATSPHLFPITLCMPCLLILHAGYIPSSPTSLPTGTLLPAALHMSLPYGICLVTFLGGPPCLTLLPSMELHAAALPATSCTCRFICRPATLGFYAFLPPLPLLPFELDACPCLSPIPFYYFGMGQDGLLIRIFYHTTGSLFALPLPFLLALCIQVVVPCLPHVLLPVLQFLFPHYTSSCLPAHLPACLWFYYLALA